MNTYRPSLGTLVLILAALLVSLLGGCGSEPTPTPRPAPTPTPVPVQQATPTPVPQPTNTPTPDPGVVFQAEWDALIEAAQTEGRLVVGTGGGASRQFRPIFEHFGQKFGIEVEQSTGGGSATVNRMLAEQQANTYELDILMVGGGSGSRAWAADAVVDISQVLIHPEVTNTSVWYGGQHRYNSDAAHPGKNLSFSFSANATKVPIEMYFNTEKLSIEEANQMDSVFDYLDPKFANQIVTGPIASGTTAAWSTPLTHPDIGEEWLRRFVDPALGVTYLEDYRLITQGIARGKYTMGVGIGAAGDDLIDLAAEGIPAARFGDILDHSVKERPELTSPGSNHNIMLVKNAPHTDAAKLFINWWLTQEGQTAMHQLSEQPTSQSLRVDVTDFTMVDPAEARDPNVEYLPYEPLPDFEQLRQQALAIVNEVRGQ